MKYEDIKITSDDYKKLSDRNKLKVVKLQLNNLFMTNSKKVVTVIYKGKKKNIEKDKMGLYKDLVEREKSLEKKVKPLYSVLTSSDEYKNMSIDERIEVMESRLDYIFNINNINATYEDEQLVAVVYKNTTKFVPKSLYDKAIGVIMMIERLEKEKNADINKEVSYTIDSKNTHKTDSTDKNSEKNTVISDNNTNNNECHSLVVVPVKKEKNKKSLREIVTGFFAVSMFTGIVSGIGKFIKKNKDNAINFINKKRNNIKKEKGTLKKIANTVTTGFVSIASNVNKSVTKIKKNVVTYIEKNKKNNYHSINNNNANRRRVTAALCAVLIMATGFVNLRSKNSKNINTSNNNIPEKSTTSMIDTTNNNNSEKNTTSMIDTDVKNTVDSSHNDILENNNIISKDENVIQKDNIEDEATITFDDTVTIDNNAYIYSNSYDATNNTNALEPYFDGNYERDVQGIVYELDGNIYVIYENEYNALEKQKELESKGAVMTAVLVTRNDLTGTNEYEGYYNTSSVKVKTR